MLGRHIRYATQEGCLSFDSASEAFAVFLTQLQQCNEGSTLDFVPMLERGRRCWQFSEETKVIFPETASLGGSKECLFLMLGRHIRYATQEGCLSFDNASEAFAVFLTQLQQCNEGSTFIADRDRGS